MMTGKPQSTAAHADLAARTIVQKRTVKAPRELVWRVWSDPHHFAQWFGPHGFTVTVHAMDFRPGGSSRFTMHGPDGTDYPNRFLYHALTRPERMAYTHDADVPNDPRAFEVVTTFADVGGATEITMSSLFQTAAQVELVKSFGAVELGQQTLAKLAALVEGMVPLPGLQQPEEEILTAAQHPELVIVRTIAAPRDLVWRACTEPAHLAKWWGPKGMGMVVERLELRPGGRFHYRMVAPDGSPSWGVFDYREVEAPARLVFSNSFADAAGNIVRAPFPGLVWPLKVLNTWTFAEHAGQTTLTLRGAPVDATEEERATFAGFRDNMRGGFAGTFDQLDAYLAALAR